VARKYNLNLTLSTEAWLARSWQQRSQRFCWRARSRSAGSSSWHSLAKSGAFWHRLGSMCNGWLSPSISTKYQYVAS